MATLSIKTTPRQTSWPFKSLITPLLMKAHSSWAIFHSAGFKNFKHNYEVFCLGFGNSTVVNKSEDDLLSIICRQTNTREAPDNSGMTKTLNKKRDLCLPTNDVAKLQAYSLNCIKSWTEFFNNKEKATEVFSGKCKYLRGMSALWHEDRTPELPLLTTSEPQYLR